MKFYSKTLRKLTCLVGVMYIVFNCKVDSVAIPFGISTSPVNVTVGGIVNGLDLNESVTLQNNGTENLTVTGSGTASDQFTFSTSLQTAESYYVTVFAQPISKTCVVGGNIGVAGSTSIMSIQVNCSVTTTYLVSGLVSGLAGSGLVLRLNGTENLPVNGNGPFAFSTTLANNDAYSATIAQQPASPSQTCSITGGDDNAGNGTVALADITNLAVSCQTNQYSVSGIITNMIAGDSVVLMNNSAQLTVNGNGTGSDSFTFPLQDDGTPYAVSIFFTPSGLYCGFTSTAPTSGTFNGANINLSLSCTNNPPAFTIGGTVSGLVGQSLAIKNNSTGTEMTIFSNGVFFFFNRYP